jgi:hypothetical protein
MAYYYQNPNHDVYAYEYGNNGNYGDEYDGYESFSDHAEPEHREYEGQYHDDADHEFASVHGHGEPEYGIQGLEELEHHHDETGGDWETGDEREIEGDEEIARELEELEYERDEVHEHGELAYEPEYDVETRRTMHEPHGFEHGNGETGGHAHLHHHPPTYVPSIHSPFSPTPPIPFPPPPLPPSYPPCARCPPLEPTRSRDRVGIPRVHVPRRRRTQTPRV